MRFLYRKYQRGTAPGFPDGIVYRPRIPIVIKTDTEPVPFDALVDTGSDQTIFPISGLEAFGVQINKKSTSQVLTLHGQPDTLYEGENIQLALYINDHAYEWPAVVWFSTNINAVPILGYSGFLEYFRAVFDGEKRELEIVPNKKFPGHEAKLWD